MNKKTISFVFLIMSVSYIYGQGKMDNTKGSETAKKQVAINFIQELYSADYEKALTKNLSKEYIEHQESAGFTSSGLKEFIKKRLKKYPQLKITIHRVIEQNDFVFLHIEEKISDKLTYVHGELFRIKNSKIMEHWSAIQKHPKHLKSGRKMYDGHGVDYSKTTGLKYADFTKQSYIDAFTLPVPKALEAIEKTTTDRYFQHNPSVVDGKEAFKNAPVALSKIAKIGIKTHLDIKRTISEGDFVVTFSYFRLPLLAGNLILFDIFRVMADGKKDEHWDVGETFKKKNLAKMF